MKESKSLEINTVIESTLKQIGFIKATFYYKTLSEIKQEISTLNIEDAAVVLIFLSRTARLLEEYSKLKFIEIIQRIQSWNIFNVVHSDL